MKSTINHTTSYFDNNSLETESILAFSTELFDRFYHTSWLLFFIIIAVMVTGILWLLSHKKKKESQNRLLFIELQSKSLLAQMHPHFAFNTLNTIKHKMSLNDKKGAEECLVDFSKLMRSTLDLSRNSWIAITEEINYLKTYTSLKNLDNRRVKLEVINSISYNLDTIEIPPLLLQPVVENSIEHGFSNQMKELIITLDLRQINFDNNTLKVVIIDNGIGIRSSNKLNTNCRRRSYGSKILKERLLLMNSLHTSANLYYTEYPEDNQNGGAKVEMIILCRKVLS
ncbi:MAG: hypothetical protein ED556_10855 [Winogradskyella sp.]|uniref:sensor histidine kinase n=1 Tax=Winogradskyella sp. TaxID=1883156 RepID=UPI000F3C1EA2|nr:histidine kinase [Winogradskyella sp.]RNC85060.1 MAG: hypothetical protein ED556_10855 [Winogradskyella sp.]